MVNKVSGKAFYLFRYTLSIVIVIESVLLIYRSLKLTTRSDLGDIMPWIAGAEALAAILLLVQRTAIAGGAILLIIFTFLLIVYGPAERSYLFVYAASVIFLMAESVYRPAPSR